MYSLQAPTRPSTNSAPSAKVWISGTTFRNTLTNVRVIEAESSHEIAVLDFIVPVRQRLWALNTPMTVEWGTFPTNTGIFLGYVHSIEHLSQATKATRTVRVTCVGATTPMKTANLRTWRGVTDSYIARTIAAQYRLVPVIDTTTVVHRAVVQSGQTDFAFLAARAKAIGYRFYVRGTFLYFVNPLLVFRRPRAFTTPVLQMGTTRGLRYPLRSFKPTVGDLVNDGGQVATRSVLGIDPRTNALVTSTNQYLRYTSFQDDKGVAPYVTRYHTEHTVESVAEAQAVLEAEAMNNRHWVSADCVSDGDARLHPLNTVFLSGDALSVDDRGLWLVRKAEHRLAVGKTGWSYSCAFTVGRDQVYTLTQNAPAEWYAAKQQVQATLQNGVWGAPVVGADSG